MADLYIHYGTDAAKMTAALMEEADVAAELTPTARVCLKPNLVLARPAQEGATTHPAVVQGVISYLHSHGVRDIVIAEGAWVGDSTARAWRTCGYEELAGRLGVPLLDTKGDDAVRLTARVLSIDVCRTPLEADYLINLPVLKGHCQTAMTCCLKNMKGCIPDREKRRFHTLGLDEPIAALNTVLRPQLHIVDSICGDLTFEEGGNPVQSNRLLLGRDPVLVDSYCARLMGYRPDDIGHLRLAREYGVGRYAGGDTSVVELGAQDRPRNPSPRSGIVEKLAGHIDEDSACSACYAALVFALHRRGKAPPQPIHIGQGYRGRRCPGPGVGNCAAGCDTHVPGCPPAALEIVEFLDRL